MANLHRFIFNSDYPMDKVVYFNHGSASVPAKSGSTNGTKTINIPHGLPFIPLPIAIWASTEDFNSSLSYEPFPYDFGMVEVKANATNISIKFESSRASAQTIYYRVYGLAPESATQEAGKNSRQNSKFIFNTGYAYAPLIFSGEITEDLDTSKVAYVNVTHGFKELQTRTSRVQIEHNLGRLPYVLFWRQSGNTVELSNGPDVQYGFPWQNYNYVDTKICNFATYMSDGQKKWHIRIYADV